MLLHASNWAVTQNELPNVVNLHEIKRELSFRETILEVNYVVLHGHTQHGYLGENRHFLREKNSAFK